MLQCYWAGPGLSTIIAVTDFVSKMLHNEVKMVLRVFSWKKKDTMNMLRVIIVGPVVKCYVTDLFRRSMSFPRHYFFLWFLYEKHGQCTCRICALSNGDSDFHRMNQMSLTDTLPMLKS